MNHAYCLEYQRPFPCLALRLRNGAEGLRGAETVALLDTGADGTLVPLAYLEEVLAPLITQDRIRSHWGEWRDVDLYAVDIEIDGLTLPSVYVVGDEMGEDIVLGRDVLNKLRILLNGPAQRVDVTG